MLDHNNYIGIIPARYASSRFPGKPIASLLGKPLIWHVYNSALKWDKWSKLLVATDDERICDVCEIYKIPYMMTSKDHSDCIDRASEVARNLGELNSIFDRYIIIQGDEPGFNPDILNVDLSPDIVNFYTKTVLLEEREDQNVVKVVVSKSLKAIYFSRFSIPYHDIVTKRTDDVISIDKQLGVYSFSYDSLLEYSNLKPSYLEGVEGIGLLRLIENDIDVYMRYSIYDSISVDTPDDLIRAERLMSVDR
ncbi:3-deoxy-manno-octulosonate cytidylyltransferase [Candidatus Pacearchaeota archaeon]|nr:3-deoxy-manno-octulosonate cytidylyltransferase [Candidatus Pacearchaeota archaeon]|tara:strand:+ start:665 stop:1414 length:750 start_codon:yes stop_codon:yes gene_type:complete